MHWQAVLFALGPLLLDILEQLTQIPLIIAVSYTHLDVYKRQI